MLFSHKQSPLRSSLLISAPDSPGSLEKVLSVLSKQGLNLSKIESHPSRERDNWYDFYLEVSNDMSEDEFSSRAKDLSSSLGSIGVLKPIEMFHSFPRKISDLDSFAHKTLDCGEELSADHPGFTDDDYRKRREDIVKIAKNYKHGQPIPRIEYTENEIATWRTVYSRLRSLIPSHACKQYNYIFPLLERECGYGPDSIPQLEDVSRFMKSCTGFTLRPVSGLLSARDFLNGLAFRVFHSTQYIRHHSRPNYTPEPDVCHELLGHVPLFADPDFAAFSQEIGLASLGVSDDDITKLATCYWFTVEFGLCRQDGQLRAYGAGLLSSFGELEYCLSDKPKLAPFDPFVTCNTEYPITTFQPLYFVSESFAESQQKMKEFSKTLKRPFSVAYDPYAQSVIVLDNKDSLTRMMNDLIRQAESIRDAFKVL